MHTYKPKPIIQSHENHKPYTNQLGLLQLMQYKQKDAIHLASFNIIFNITSNSNAFKTDKIKESKLY